MGPVYINAESLSFPLIPVARLLPRPIHPTRDEWMIIFGFDFDPLETVGLGTTKGSDLGRKGRVMTWSAGTNQKGTV